MRAFVISVLASIAILASVPAAPPAFADDGAVTWQQANPPSDPAGGSRVGIDVDIDRGDARPWYVSPLWIGIGVVALLLIVVLALVGRGGGTTIVKT